MRKAKNIDTWTKDNLLIVMILIIIGFLCYIIYDKAYYEPNLVQDAIKEVKDKTND